MSIQVVCPSCQTRFKVSDKFAGKSGACPKCKGKIQVPDVTPEVVIHEDEHSEAGAKDARGQFVLKPVSRTDTKFSPVVLMVVVIITIAAFGAAFVMRGTDAEPSMIIFGCRRHSSGSAGGLGGLFFPSRR